MHAGGSTGLNELSKMDHEYSTYIVASLSGTLYIGVINNIERRMFEHPGSEFEGFASKYHCTRLCTTKASTTFERPSTARSNSKAGVGRRRLH